MRGGWSERRGTSDLRRHLRHRPRVHGMTAPASEVRRSSRASIRRDPLNSAESGVTSSPMTRLPVRDRLRLDNAVVSRVP
jgi:hypothetical protein